MAVKGVVFDIQRWSLHDGPGIRTNVFFKGCPLSCKWCSNPESQERFRELAYFRDKCIGCKSCIEKCPNRALSWGQESDDGVEPGLRIQYGLCRRLCSRTEGERAFSCTGNCYAKALSVTGWETTADEVLREVLSDEAIYRSSDGGMTVTGGEPLSQPEFLLELLKAAKEKGLHNAMETCLYAPWSRIEPCLAYLDFIFMDFKLLDETRHIQYTGVGNGLILENMKRISQYAANHRLELAVRTPVIPGINDSREEIGAMADWIRENVPGAQVYELLAYHRLGRGKYGNIGKKYSLGDIAPPDGQYMKTLETEIRKRGLKNRYC